MFVENECMECKKLEKKIIKNGRIKCSCGVINDIWTTKWSLD